MEAAWTGLQIEPSSPGLVRVFRNSVIKEKMDYENKERMAKAMAAMKKAEKKASSYPCHPPYPPLRIDTHSIAPL